MLQPPDCQQCNTLLWQEQCRASVVTSGCGCIQLPNTARQDHTEGQQALLSSICQACFLMQCRHHHEMQKRRLHSRGLHLLRLVVDSLAKHCGVWAGHNYHMTPQKLYTTTGLQPLAQVKQDRSGPTLITSNCFSLFQHTMCKAQIGI
ncbi:hypothetical protein ABBQ38_007281 [Trebouxia sp. C0009 RCD-2024]